MRDGQPNEIRLGDYRPPAYTTTHTRLHFDIRDGQTTVTNSMTVRRQDDAASVLKLDGQELELLSVALDGRELSGNEYGLDGDSLTLFGLAEQHEVTIVTRIVPERNTALEGLYRSSNMYCTQCEAEGFRRITYYQDRPDVQSRFTTTIVADAGRYPTLLSNGNLVGTDQPEPGRHSATWEDPFPKPSYLFALVAGNLSVLEDTFTTFSGRQVELKIYSEPHNIGQCHYAMDALKRSMSWDERRFGREYDLDIYMIVAVEDFNMGAMENKGLNIFNTSCVLATPDTATDANYQRVEGVIAHEYFHNWSGNRVTCRDWFQLSLKEGFTVFRDAEFTADMNSRAVKRIDDVQLLRALQFAEDASPLAHPVRPQSYQEISNFYTLTVYEKGAEVVRMYQTLLGPRLFRQATDVYFERFDGSAATTDDFAGVMAEVGGLDLSQFKRWYDQAGTPVLDVVQSFRDGELTLNIRQSCPATPGQSTKAPFHIPVLLGLLRTDTAAQAGAVDLASVTVDSDAAWQLRDGGASMLLELRATDTVLRIGGLDQAPVVSLLREFSAPVRVRYPRPSQDLVYLAQHDVDGFVRWDALQTLWVDWFDQADQSDPAPLLTLMGELGGQALALPDDGQAKLLAAIMLRVPEENYLFEALRGFDVLQVVERREALLDQLAHAHEALWRELYERNRAMGAYRPDAAGKGRRALANLAFMMIARTLTGAALTDWTDRHYASADNLTDRRAALLVACNHGGYEPDAGAALLEDFYGRWHTEALVLDQWFALQAQSPLTDVAGLRRLEAHERFDLRNPNRARSVIGQFGLLNHRTLHALDGSGYRYLADAVARVDRLNPQVAARLVTPLTRWERYDAARQKLMQASLATLLELEGGPSKDLYEIVSKSLG